MAGHALAVADAFPKAEIVGIEPAGADDFCQSLDAQQRVRIERPQSICDGLCSYDVGEHNWPILQRYVPQAVAVPDADTQAAMRWLYQQHGLRCEPSGAIAVAAVLTGRVRIEGEGDIALVVSGRNVDDEQFRAWIE